MKFIVTEQNREYEFLLSPGIFTIGRDRTCDLALESKRVSRRHMSCTVTQNEIRVRDMGSRNHIYVGGVQAKEALLKDGDEVRVGDVKLVFRAAGPEAFPGTPRRPGGAGPAAEASLEDAEATPELGSLVPQGAAETRPQLVQQAGRWFVRDAATGRQVEIVPAAQARLPAPRKSLLATTKGKLLLAGAALLVLVLLSLALLRSPEVQTQEAASAAEFNQKIALALESLGRGETAEARRLAEGARLLRPRSETAAIVAELTDLWDPWRKDFFAYYRKVETALQNLYGSHAGREIENFVREYKDWIDQELEYLRRAQRGKAAFEQDRYEDAWQELKDIPQGSPIRERDADLFTNVRASLHRHLKTQMQSAAVRQDWAIARQWAQKLSDDFPEEEPDTDQVLSRYIEFQNHAELMQTAKTALSEQGFAEAEQALLSIPQGSPYYAEAARLLQRAKAGGQYARALALYNQGSGEEAVEVLSSQDTDAARVLKRHVEQVVALRKAAVEEQREMNLVRAQQQWQSLVQIETDPDNYYRKEALRELDAMSERQSDLARQLAEHAARLYKDQEYEKARKLYEQAMVMDPEGRTGALALEKMLEQGRMDYRRALNLKSKDPQRALELFTRACRLLPPEDKYYNWAAEQKRELEQKP